MITNAAHPEANIIWGTAFDEGLSDEMHITVVATGFEHPDNPGGSGSVQPGVAAGLGGSSMNAVGAGNNTRPVFNEDRSSAEVAPAPVEKPKAEEDVFSDGSLEEIIKLLNNRQK